MVSLGKVPTTGDVRVTLLARTVLMLPLLLPMVDATAEPYLPWQVRDYAIAEPLGGLIGDAVRGRAVVVDRARGNCLACHQMPIPEQPAHGTIGPPLYGVGARLTAAQLRLRVVDEKQINPETIMPGFYRAPPLLNRPRPDATGTILTAQEVEDVVAYLGTLK